MERTLAHQVDGERRTGEVAWRPAECGSGGRHEGVPAVEDSLLLNDFDEAHRRGRRIHMTVASGSEEAAPVRKARVKPSFGAGLVVYAVYLAIFYTTWAVNKVDYNKIGETASSAKLHYALPTLFGGISVVILVTAFGWWKSSLFDRERSGPKWAWIGPILMFALAIVGYSTMKTGSSKFSSELVFWSILGGIGVGFGEEMITRGSMVVGLRAKHDEQKVWLYSSLLFAALHAPNALFGESIGGTAGQLVTTFIFGGFFFAMRRISGTLLLPMFLHGLWDSSLFLPRATGGGAGILPILLIPIAIVVTWGVVHRNGHKHIEP